MAQSGSTNSAGSGGDGGTSTATKVFIDTSTSNGVPGDSGDTTSAGGCSSIIGNGCCGGGAGGQEEVEDSNDSNSTGNFQNLTKNKTDDAGAENDKSDNKKSEAEIAVKMNPEKSENENESESEFKINSEKIENVEIALGQKLQASCSLQQNENEQNENVIENENEGEGKEDKVSESESINENNANAIKVEKVKVMEKEEEKEEEPIYNLGPGPHNIDLVDEKLYLGNLSAACDINVLDKFRIKYILTIDSCPLPTIIKHLPHLETKFIQLCDIPREDILRFFDETNQFIQKAVSGKNSGNVLVHCYFGVSRSATLVLAYLMKKYEIPLEDAIERLKAKRGIISPNYGFLSQLKLYEKMKFRIEKSNLFYKRFRLHMASDKFKSVKILSHQYADVIKSDPAQITVKPEPVVLQCKKCRRILASASNLLPHQEKKSPVWFDFQSEEESSGGGGGGTTCTQMYFIEPLLWMLPIIAQNLQGKLHCPNQNCKSKLGSFSWIMGCLCPCSAKVQPSFYLVPSKVDRSNSVLNLQITL